MAFQPASSLNNRTFIGLIIAQFLAGFNDQAIHAAAMFYAIKTEILPQETAIALMPILFFSPWAIFCTLAGYLADRYSKTYTLVIWKFSEILISLILIVGFMLGTHYGMAAGAWIVLGCVFLMGLHSAFFVPAKYGSMAEILQGHVISRGNGVLESTTFLATIFGTVSGGLLSSFFRDHEEYIGYILLVLSIIGAAASLMIARLPAANPTRPFPVNLFKPLYDNIRLILRARPLRLAALGIAFFIFMVSYMRAAVYMHGESQNPRWDEFHTSIIVATVALGIGLGAPMAGYLSGGKVELGLVPIGCLGMTLALILAALQIHHTPMLIVALVIIGFFSGFYMVPLYSLLQHRAPKTSKGDLTATSNFINTTGAIAASVLFQGVVLFCQVTEVTPSVPVNVVSTGQLVDYEKDEHGHYDKVIIREADADIKIFRAKSIRASGEITDEEKQIEVIEFNDDLLRQFGRRLSKGEEVVASSYRLHGIQHYLIRARSQAERPVYNFESLPRFLFLGGSGMAIGILLLLWWQLPDFFVRSLFWFQSLRRPSVQSGGMQHLPIEGPVILVTNVETLERTLQLVSVTDRTTKVVLIEANGVGDGPALLRTLARRVNLIELHADALDTSKLEDARAQARQVLAEGHLLALSLGPGAGARPIEMLVRELHAGTQAPVIPAYCGPSNIDETHVYVMFGPHFSPEISLADMRKAIQDAQHERLEH